MLALLAHPLSQPEVGREKALQFGLAPDLARDIAADPTEIGPDRPERPTGAPELLGVGVALVSDQRMLADPFIGLAQAHPGLLRQPHQPLARPVHKLRIGWEGDRLRLHRGVDDEPRKVRRFRCAGARRDRQALSWISATSFSSPMRFRQRVSDERSKGVLCRKNSSPCMDGPGFARTLTFRLTGRLRSCIRPLAQPDQTAGLDGIRKPDALSQNRTQGARRGTGLVEPGCRPSAIMSLSFARRSFLNSFSDSAVSWPARSAMRRTYR